MFDLDHPFFRPAWRRVAVLALCFGWAAWELASGAVFWAIVFAALGGVAIWQFHGVDWSKYDDPGE
ncbi:MAG: hypothetical protein AAGE76_03695 [Pseudomonadota bacterium]